MQVHEPTPTDPAVQQGPAEPRLRGPAQGHVLVVGLQRRGPAVPEPRHRSPLRGVAHPVVSHFVVVRYDDPGRGRMRSLEIRVRLVEPVPTAVLGECAGLRSVDVADVPGGQDPAASVVLVEVVAEEEDQVGPVLGNRAVSGEVALLEVRARGDRDRRAGGQRIAAGRRTTAADRRDRRVPAEPVVELAVRRKSEQLHVHRVRCGRACGNAAVPHDRAEAIVERHLPLHLEVPAGHPAAAVGRDRVHRETGPDDEPVRPGVPRCDPEAERRRRSGDRRRTTGGAEREARSADQRGRLQQVPS